MTNYRSPNRADYLELRGYTHDEICEECDAFVGKGEAPEKLMDVLAALL